MAAPQEFADIKKILETGKPVEISVRTLLGWFNAQRRGYYIVQQIRRALLEEGLRTDPDFEYAYIDGLVQFLLDKAETVSASNGTGTAVATAPDLVVEAAEPTPAISDPT